jgi:hypothetical protein
MKQPVRFFAFLFFFIPALAEAQFFADNAMPDSATAVAASQKIGFKFNSVAFFKNNEYFHPLVEGYTLPGFQLQPRLYYKWDEKFSLEAGVHLSQFSGKEDLDRFDPLFRATYSPTQHFSILLGWLKGTTAHQLIEPLFQWERMYTHPLEYGVQFLVDRPGFKLDTWIDWEKYIELNDPFQEELTFGTSAKVRLHQGDRLEIWFPVQATIKHQGGQVTAIDMPLKTLTNWATGFNVTLHRSSPVLKRLMFDLYYVGFSDFSPQKKQAFTSGFGLYPVVSANIAAFQAALGYWYGNDFMSPKGEPLFQSASVTDPLKTQPERNVVTFKSSFYKQIFKDVSFGAYFESYYDVHIGQMDYAYGISMSVSGDVLFKKL